MPRGNISPDQIVDHAAVAGNVPMYDADGVLVDSGSAPGGGGSGTVTHTGALTADLPVFGNGSDDIKVGTKTGNTNAVVSATGATTSGYPLLYDASGNAIGRQPRGNTTVVQLADVTTNPTNGNAAKFDANGNIKDGGGPLAATKASTSHQFLISYDAATGLFVAAQPTEADLSISDITTNNVTSSAHGLAPKSPADATKFLNGAATPAYAQVKDSDLSTSDITTNNVTSSKHGFTPKSPADATKFLNGDTTPAFALVKDSDLSISDITTNNVSTSAHGFAPKAPGDATKFLNGANPPAWTTPSGGGGSASYFGMATLTTPPTTGWSTDNLGTGSFDVTNGYPYLSAPRAGAVQVRVAYRTAPSTPYTWTVLLVHDMFGAPPGASGSGLNASAGLFFRDGSGKLIEFGYALDAVVLRKWTNSTSFGANYSTYAPPQQLFRGALWLQIGDDGTNLTFKWAIDGNHWKQFDTRTRTDFFASGPTQVGFGSYVNGDAVETCLASVA